MSFLTHLECSRCGTRHEAGKPHNLCQCGGPLLVRYDLERARREWPRDAVAAGPNSMWRYSGVLPSSKPVSLGEGMTPMIHALRLGAKYGTTSLYVKDEGLNPTGSFKARGLSCAITMMRELGSTRLAIPSAGNAASAAAAYAAAAGIEAHIFMPKDVPLANYAECVTFGAKVTMVDGLISDCGKIVAERGPKEGWFDVSTLKEPYRIEGKKTMGYEVAEQFGWTLPDAIFYPTGGGVGLIGMWKAFEEMETMGWLPTGGKRPKMISVQAAGCAPIVRAFERGEKQSEFWQGATTMAAGLRVPKALGDFLVLDYVRASSGTCISVTDEEIRAAVDELGAAEGIFAAPEGAACVTAYAKLRESGFLKASDKVVLFNTGAGLKYLDMMDFGKAK
jgi:threonine synthase